LTRNISNNLLNKTLFEQLFREHFNPMCHFVMTYVSDHDAAQEIVQDVFINLWQKRETITSTLTLKSYLFTSAKNRSLNYIRDQKKFRSYVLDIEAELEETVVEDIFAEQETADKINAALEKLPAKCRQVFELSRYDELKYKEIADKLGISQKTVEIHISKALKVLREELKDLIKVIIWIILSINNMF